MVGFTSGVRPTARMNHLLIKGMTLMGCRAGEAVRQGQADGAARLEVLRGWAKDGVLRPHVSHVLPIEEAKQAFQLLWSRQVTGRACVAPFGVDAAKERLATPPPLPPPPPSPPAKL